MPDEQTSYVVVLHDQEGNLYFVPGELSERCRVPDELKAEVQERGARAAGKDVSGFGYIPGRGSGPPGADPWGCTPPLVPLFQGGRFIGCVSRPAVSGTGGAASFTLL